jgi:flavin reductase (DIM6/NTAB) family NADH-FMN oxidoreductase RutF
MHVRMSELGVKQKYKLISSAIVPRPIALITTLSPDGRCNAAPFSAFNYVSEDPPLVAVGLQTRYESGSRVGELKDTTRNVSLSGRFVVNFVDEALCRKMVDCAIPFPSEDSEVAVLGLATADSVSCDVPRIVDSPIAFECRQLVMLNFSAARSVLIGEVDAAYVRDDVLDRETFNLDLDAYRPVGRLFGSLYCSTDKRVSIPTRTHEQWLKDTAR